MAEDRSSNQPPDPEPRPETRPTPMLEPAPGLADLTDLAQEDLSAEDMEDIQRLLEQKLDVTRQDMTAQDFQSLLARYTKP